MHIKIVDFHIPGKMGLYPLKEVTWGNKPSQTLHSPNESLMSDAWHSAGLHSALNSGKLTDLFRVATANKTSK